jgi:hypothetical protein
MTASAQTPPVAPETAGTEYTVLVSDGAGFLVDAPSVTARDAASAIRQHLEGADTVDALYVAVPARSWKPVRVKTKIALEFGEPS